ncbi:MAG: hypothetical protein QHC67_16215 [Sphingobium sp.]|uniref:hypothetical protein n=1 Tax=Sphingobium sp. TaxID=1912891 RepID=UPI0029B94785|nr:hypothetical protein [Sphingobium sp.]MDX3911341.1 hypothetical protein [Sphingobium sp.]
MFLKSLHWKLFLQLAVHAALIGAAQAQTPKNPPEVQQAFEQAANTIKGQHHGLVTASDTVIGDHSLEIRFRPSTGIDQAKAAEAMKTKATSWAKAMCASSTIPPFLRRTGATLIVTFETAPGVYEVQSKVDRTSCAERPTEQLQYINGKPLYPRPSPEAAVESIRNRLKFSLMDFDSAKIECTDLSEAVGVKPILEPRRYGYVIRCEINAKNAYGGYTGYETRWYYFNGPSFEEVLFNPKIELLKK